MNTRGKCKWPRLHLADDNRVLGEKASKDPQCDKEAEARRTRLVILSL
jgi:hypothetical protein